MFFYYICIRKNYETIGKPASAVFCPHAHSVKLIFNVFNSYKLVPNLIFL